MCVCIEIISSKGKEVKDTTSNDSANPYILSEIDPLIHSDESDFQTQDNKIIPKVYPYNNHFLPASSNVKQVLIQFINHNFRGVGKEEPVFSQFRILKIISSDELNQNWLKADKVNMPNGQLNLIIGTTNKPGKLFC